MTRNRATFHYTTRTDNGIGSYLVGISLQHNHLDVAQRPHAHNILRTCRTFHLHLSGPRRTPSCCPNRVGRGIPATGKGSARARRSRWERRLLTGDQSRRVPRRLQCRYRGQRVDQQRRREGRAGDVVQGNRHQRGNPPSMTSYISPAISGAGTRPLQLSAECGVTGGGGKFRGVGLDTRRGETETHVRISVEEMLLP
jgi:hypothetical protein